MELNKAAVELGISTRHLHRLIRLNALPAQKVTVQQIITKRVWDVDDAVLHAAAELLQDLKMYELYVGRWLQKWMDSLRLSAVRLAQMSRVKKNLLLQLIDAEVFPADMDAETREKTKWQIATALLREQIRQNTQKGGDV